MRDTGADQGTVRNLFPAYRVFVEGIEVTPLVSSVRIQWPEKSPAQCSLEIANPAALMTITRQDMITIAKLRDGTVQRFLDIYNAQLDQTLEQAFSNDQNVEYGSLASFRGAAGVPQDQFILSPNDILRGLAALRRGQDAFFPTVAALPPVTAELAEIKNRVIPKKLDVASYNQSTTNVDGTPLPAEVFFKYPFVLGKWIWHHGDRVRVVFRHLTDPTVWYWMHAGTVTDIAERETEDHQSTLTLTSEDVLKDLRNARVVNLTGAYLSPRAFKGPAGEVSTFSDDQLSAILSAVPYSSFLQNLTLYQIVELMIFGVGTILDDLGQAVREGQDPRIISERFGIPLDTNTNVVTDEAIKAREQQLRGLNLGGLSKFKKWKKNQGVEVRILGGPLTPEDQAIGEQVDSLPRWHSLLDNQVNRLDLVAMSDLLVDETGGPTASTGGRRVPEGLKTTFARMQLTQAANTAIEDVITQIGTNPDAYPIRQRVRMLLPAHLGSRLNRKVLDQDLASCPASQAEFFDRLSLLQQVIDRIDFCLYATPRGDVVVEMPFYDFEPRHFTRLEGSSGLFNDNLEVPRSPTQLLKAFADSASKLLAVQGDTGLLVRDDDQYVLQGSDGPVRFKIDLNAALFQGGLIQPDDYESVFAIFRFEQCTTDVSSSEQDIKTAWVSVPRFQVAQKGDPASSARKRVHTFLPNLVPLYGLRIEQGDPQGQITTEEAARVFNHIQLNKANADATNFRITCLPNWQAWPNRPLFIEGRGVISTTKSINHSIVWQSDCATEYGLWHTKFWDGRFVERNGARQPLFVPFGGVNAQPYNFAYLLGIDRRERALNVRTGQADVNAAFSQAGAKPGGTP
jgi:hypothetical protein